MHSLPFYPPSPADVSADVTAPSAAYRLRAAGVAVAVGLFFLSYLAAAMACVAYILWAAVWCPWDDGAWLVVKAIAMALIVPVGGFLGYWLSALANIRSAPPPDAVEIFEADHPRLFAFIERLCDEIGVARPAHVFLDDRVNASAVLETPDGNGLLIGIGLIQCLSLCEFKAILAHEIGHFSQRSVALNRYVRIAGQVVAYLMRGDTGLERVLRAWAGLHLSLAWPAHAVLVVLRSCRGTLAAMWGMIYRAHQALAREEELHADRIAVRFAGSDALIDALAACAIADECVRESEPPTFAAGGIDDHPSDAERECNARAIPIAADRDERSARLLFGALASEPEA
ncbi:MAG: M48 family metallopeptidase [Deltaproteobacteria bacterium]|nr:M48 family metallopeptidase [Deltaproteobacteria bacterium]